MTDVVDAPAESAASPDQPQAPTTWGRGGPVRRYAPVAALVLAVAIAALVTSRGASNGLPFDPSSTGPDGTKALTLILDRVGADVSVLRSTDELDVDTLLVLVDNLGDESVAHINDFVAAGGTVFVADASGALSSDLRPAGRQSVGMFAPAMSRRCDVAAFEGINRVRTGGSPLFVVPDDAVGCFTVRDAAWLLITDRGSGTVVTTGAPTFLINSFIGDVDNAALAAAVLAPRPGTRVGILRPDFATADAQGEPTSLIDLIPGQLIGAFLQLTLAFLIVVLWRMRRLGKPVSEPQLVQLAGSELVIAMGNLLQRTGSRQRAAELLREDFRRSISHRLGLPRDLPAQELAEVAADRTGADADRILGVLAGPAPGDDAGLVALAHDVEAVRNALNMSPSVPAGASRVASQ